jgi:carboxypeptidase C (cathepsin A)
MKMNVSTPLIRGMASACAVLGLAALSTLPAAAQRDHNPAKPAAPPAAAPAAPAGDKADYNKLPPLPADKSVDQSIVLNGKTLHYTVTVGTLPVREPNGQVAGELVYTAYTVDQPDRPVTFAVNGGPGASSVFLNFGAIGPKHLDGIGNKNDSASEPIHFSDNQGTWLGFTDLVFLDPIGTGFSRSLVDPAEAKKLFFGPVTDVDYLSEAIYGWLVKNGRMTSRKYMVGESYGGYRVPRIVYNLQSNLGVAMNGEVLVSPYMNPAVGSQADLSPLPWMLTLPPITAANLERQGKLTTEAMQSVIQYDEGDYATALIKGNSDPALQKAMIQKVTEMTGLDPTFVKESGGRLETAAYLREVWREQGKVGSVYDSNVTMYDPFPWSPWPNANDPLLASMVGPTTTAMVDFDTQTVGWKTEAQYYALSYDVNRAWDRNNPAMREGSVTQLRDAIAADPKFRVVIAHGWDDLSCPFMGSVLTVNEMPVMGDPARVSVHEFPGGHMFYTRETSRIAFQKIVEDMFSKH